MWAAEDVAATNTSAASLVKKRLSSFLWSASWRRKGSSL